MTRRRSIIVFETVKFVVIAIIGYLIADLVTRSRP